MKRIATLALVTLAFTGARNWRSPKTTSEEHWDPERASGRE